MQALAMGEVEEGLVHRKHLDIRRDVGQRMHDRGGDLRAPGGDWHIYITGHSLGGALAIISQSDLSRDPDLIDRLGVCYTFGSPREGDRKFGDLVKAPIYRVVHAADIVPRVPPAHVFGLLAWLARLIPWKPVSERAEQFFVEQHGYMHHGDIHYLTGHDTVDSGLRLIPNTDGCERLFRVWDCLRLRWNRADKDHSIDACCNKLGDYARNRQKYPDASGKPV